MWTLWPTAPLCSGSSSAAGHISDKCAARPARDTDTAKTHSIHLWVLCSLTVSPNPSRWASWAAALALPLSEECGVLTGTLWCRRLVLWPFGGTLVQTYLRAELVFLHIPLEGGLLKPGETERGILGWHLSLCLSNLSLFFCNNLVLLYFTLATGLVADILSSTCLCLSGLKV